MRMRHHATGKNQKYQSRAIADRASDKQPAATGAAGEVSRCSNRL
jgi:hypothetical protein